MCPTGEPCLNLTTLRSLHFSTVHFFTFVTDFFMFSVLNEDGKIQMKALHADTLLRVNFVYSQKRYGKSQRTLKFPLPF